MQILKSPQRVRNAMEYVLCNGEKHGVFDPSRGAGGVPQVDPWSSAAWFPHWAHRELCLPALGCGAGVVHAPQTYLLRTAFCGEGRSYWSEAVGLGLPQRSRERGLWGPAARSRERPDGSARLGPGRGSAAGRPALRGAADGASAER